jgi:glutamate dehydrogenase
MNDRRLFKKVTECCIPRALVEEIGFATLSRRVPMSYLKALFASELASRYVYRYGLEANEVSFYEFLKQLR